MKNFLLSLLLLCPFLLNAQVLNGGFENWTAGNPDNWATSNVFPISVIPITQTTDKHSGNYAVKGEVIPVPPATISGILQSGNDATGTPVSEKYHSITLYYKFAPVGGDIFAVNVALEKEGIPIAQGILAIEAGVSTYTYLAVPLVYTSDDIPDRAVIQLSIVGPTGSDTHAGSIMYVDDVELSMLNDVEEATAPSVSCYPNPATDQISFRLTQGMESSVKIIDLTGKEVKTVDFSGKSCNVNISDLPSGIYFYRLGNFAGKFNKK